MYYNTFVLKFGSIFTESKNIFGNYWKKYSILFIFTTDNDTATLFFTKYC